MDKNACQLLQLLSLHMTSSRDATRNLWASNVAKHLNKSMHSLIKKHPNNKKK